MRIFILALKFLVTIGAVVFLLLYVDRSAVLDRLRNISLSYVTVALLLALVQIFIAGYRWSILVHFFSERNSIFLTQRQTQLINYSSQFVGQMLPFLAADALRVIYARAAGMSLKAAFLSTAFDRGIALLLLVGLCAVALIVSPWMGSLPGLRLIVVALASLTVVGTASALIFGEALASLLAKNRILRAFSELVRAFRRLAVHLKVVVPVVLLALSVHGISIVIFWLLCLGQNLSVSITDMLTIVPLLMLGAAIPISIAGWGVREGLTVALFAGIDIPAEFALAASLSFGAVILAAALPGAVTTLMLPTRSESDANVPDTEAH